MFHLKALALFSGGLDSLLAIKLIQETGVEVETVHFLQPFLEKDQEEKLVNQLKKLIDQLQAKLHIIRLDQRYLRILETPKHGYGKAANPCLDCHIFFLQEAADLMKKIGASFLVTGEVVGQRPKSQHQGAFPIIDQETGLAGLIVRPLSAGLLPATIPEEKGWISLEHCPSIQGRQRKVQLELAKKYGLTYQAPAGGCLLTNVEYGRKVFDLLRHEGKLDSDSLRLLAVGRHFRLSPEFKIIIGRDQKENSKILRYFYKNRRDERFFLLKVDEARGPRAYRVPGPLAMGIGAPSPAELTLFSLLSTRYSDLAAGKEAVVRILQGGAKHYLRKERVTATKDPSLPQKYRIT